MTKKTVVKRADLRDLVLNATPVELTAEGAAPSRVRIARFGENPTTKGPFVLRPEDARAMVERAKARGIKQHSDYEHASVHAAQKGTEAPASAWYDLEVGEDGLYANNIEWTPPALERLKNREYRYMSPWFGQREDGSVGSFKNFALTNRPATDNLAPLVAADDDALHGEASPPEKPKMKTLFKQLALSEDASEAEALAAVQSLGKERDAFYTATGTKDMPSALAAFETARAKAAKAEELETELKGIKAGSEKKEREMVLNEAVEIGAIQPNMKDLWASDTFSLDQLKAYVAKTGKTRADRSKTAAAAPKEKDPADEIDIALTEQDKGVAKSLQMSEEDFAKHKKLMLGRA